MADPLEQKIEVLEKMLKSSLDNAGILNKHTNKFKEGLEEALPDLQKARFYIDAAEEKIIKALEYKPCED